MQIFYNNASDLYWSRGEYREFKANQADRAGAEEDVTSNEQHRATGPFRVEMTWSSEVWAAISELLSREKSVLEVWGAIDNVSYYILTLIGEYDRDARRRIYELQDKISDRYGKFLLFDFNVLALEGRESSEIVTGIDLLYRRRA